MQPQEQEHHFLSKLKPLFLFLLSFAPIPFLVGLIPLACYDKQDLHIRVCDKQIFVSGQYEYHNPFPFPISQGFSFVLDPKQGSPEDLTISVLAPEQRNVPVNGIAGYRCYTITFMPFQKKAVQVSYHQRCPSNEAIFPITASRTWGRPLPTGSYALQEIGTKILYSNYNAERQGRILMFERKNFKPSEDWKFSWNSSGS